MHPVRLSEKDPPLRRGDRGTLQKVFEHAGTAPVWMHTLDWLPELHLVTHQDDVAGGGSYRHQVGQGYLPGLIDKEEIEGSLPFLPRKEPGRPRHQLGLGWDVLVVEYVGDHRPAHVRVVVVAVRFLEASDDHPLFESSRLNPFQEVDDGFV